MTQMFDLDRASLGCRSDETRRENEDAFPTSLAGDHHHVLIRPGSTDLLIVFAGTGRTGGLFDFWPAAQLMTCNVILLNNGRDEWYQNGVPGLGDSIEATVDTLLAWKAALGATNVCTTGTSMGGYGAVLFGAKLGARVLTFGLDTKLMSSQTRSKKMLPPDVIVRYPELRPIIASTKTPVTCYIGEADTPDLMAAALIKSLPSVRIVALRGVDHGSARYIHNFSDLTAFLEVFVSGEPMPDIPYQGEMTPSMKRLFFAQDCLVAGDIPGVERYARLALKLDPFCETALYFMGRACHERGDYGEAIGYLGTALGLTPHYEDAHYHLTSAMKQTADHVRALELARDHTRRWPLSGRGHYQLAQILRKSDREASLASLETAVELKPKRHAWVALLAKRRAEA